MRSYNSCSIPIPLIRKSKEKNNKDIVFTTKKIKFKAGDSVIAKGKLIIDKDFGCGYFYKVIIQESSFSKN